MAEPLEPSNAPAPEDRDSKPKDERSRKSGREGSRYTDEIPSGTFRIPRV